MSGLHQPLLPALVMALVLLLVAACGAPLPADSNGVSGGSSPDSPPPATPPLKFGPPSNDMQSRGEPPRGTGNDRPGCGMTLAGHLGPYEVVPGEDPVPSAPDPINVMGCTFERPVARVTIVLRQGETERAWTHDFPQPVTHIGLPLADGVLGTVPADMPLGEYHREVRVTFEDGETETLPAVRETIHVVAEKGQAAFPTPILGGGATPPPAGSHMQSLVVVVAGQISDAIFPRLEAFEEAHGVRLIRSEGESGRMTDRMMAEHAAGRYTTDVAFLDAPSTQRLVSYGIVQSWTPLKMEGLEDWNVVVLATSPNPEERALFFEWLGIE